MLLLLLPRWSPDTSFTPAALLSIASGVASALAYLHGHGVCHGDVYAHNVLVDGDAHATLVDFGEHKQALSRDILRVVPAHVWPCTQVVLV